MKPETVLHELRDRYAGLQSYQDEGVVLTNVPDSDFVIEREFATFFRRPDRFRFDLTWHHPYPPLKHITVDHCIWQSAAGVRRWWQGEGTTPVKSVRLAIAALAGISLGASHTVPSMLLSADPAFASRMLTVQAMTLGETEGIDCHCVIAFDSRKRPYRFYIGRDDLLLRRVSSSLKDGAISDEIRRGIRTGHLIDESVFAIDRG